MLDPKIYPESLLIDLKNKLSKVKYRNSESLPKFIFLCGESKKKGSQNRFLLKEYFEKYGVNTVYPIFVEDLWEKTKDITVIDLLTYEHFLAETCDKIVLFVESIGSAAELGSFASLKNLIDKLIVVIPDKYENRESFINMGPIRKIRRKGNNKDIYYCNIEAVLGDSQFVDRIRKIIDYKKTEHINLDAKSVKISSYFLEIIDLVSVAGPIMEKHIIEVYKYVKGFTSFDFSTKIYDPIYAVDCLKCCGIFKDNIYGYVNINKSIYNNDKLFMFDMAEQEYNVMRSKFLARKYKYLDNQTFIV